MPGKPAVASVTVWAALVVVIAQVVKILFGYDLTAADQQLIVSAIQQIVEIASTVATIIGALAALWGRIRAAQPITGVIKPRGNGNAPQSVAS